VLVERHRAGFYSAIYRAEEIQRSRNDVNLLASLFAAKEATSKALGTGFAYMVPTGVKPSDIEIILDETRPAKIRLFGTALERAMSLNLSDWALTLSFFDDHALAFVIASAD
jgi:holo-[acyl-carrier protein] synthase